MQRITVIIDKNLDFEQDYLDGIYSLEDNDRKIYLIRDTLSLLSFFHYTGGEVYSSDKKEWDKIIIGELPNIYENIPEEYQGFEPKSEDVAGGRILFVWNNYSDCFTKESYITDKVIPLFKYLKEYGVPFEKCFVTGLSLEQRNQLLSEIPNLDDKVCLGEKLNEDEEVNDILSKIKKI